MSTTIEFLKWRAGVKTICVVLLVRDTCNLSLASAHSMVDQIIEVQNFTHTFKYCKNPRKFIKDLSNLGIEARLL